MRIQIEKMINVLNEAGNLQIDRSVDQVTLHNVSDSTLRSDPTANIYQVLKTFSTRMRAITAEYRKVVEAAESLAERDAKANDERVKGLEERAEEAVSLLEVKDREVEDRDHQILALRNTVHDITRLLGTFIQTHLPSWADTMTDPRTQQVMHIVADYTHDHPSSVDYVRVPEHTFNKYASDLRDSRNLVGEFRKVLHGQSAMIKDQSQNLDSHVVKYEQAVKLVHEKDHEILLLVRRNDDLTRQLQDTQAALAESQDAAAEAEITGRRYDELRGNMQSLKTAHELELDQKDAEIANIRQKLGSAREEVFARREDVKNVVAQSQALRQLQPDPHAAATVAAAKPSSSASKALRFFGMERDKLKKGSIPSSHSTLGLSSVDARFSSKEVAPAVSKEALRYRPSLQTHDNPRSARTAPNTPVITFQGSSGFTGAVHATRPFSDSHPTPPRSDSLGVPQHCTSNPTSPVAPVDRFKPLPENPISKSQLATARLADVTSSIESPLQAQITSDYLSHGIMGQTAQSARRVLSRITEVSTPMSHRSEDDDQAAKLERVHEDNGSDHSVASSDRKIYRTSISALDMLNSSSNFPYSETETDMERIMRATGIAAGSGSPQARSINRRAAGTHANAQQMQEEDYEDAHTGVARVLHVRPGNRDLRRAGGTHDGIAEEYNRRDPHAHRRQFGVIGDGRIERRPLHPRDRESSGESIQGRLERFRNPARESLVSNESSAGYRTEDSEPKTVAQMYHAGGKHIRG
jgi:predicted proteasome-type protease